jgi:DNA-binding transcriptional MerR regulator
MKAGSGPSRNSSNHDIVIARRQQVARLRLRGLSIRDIVQALAMPPLSMTDPKTGRAYSIGTIHRDLKAIKAEWQESAQEDIAAWRAQQIAEIAEVKRAAWLEKDLGMVLRAIQQEVDIIGTKAPTRADVTSGDAPLSIILDI